LCRSNQAAALKEWLPLEYRERIDTLMTFPENTAGSLASVDYIAVWEGWTVRRTLEHIRKVAKEADVVTYAYVVDAQGRLLDVVSLRELILADPDAPFGACHPRCHLRGGLHRPRRGGPHPGPVRLSRLAGGRQRRPADRRHHGRQPL